MKEAKQRFIIQLKLDTTKTDSRILEKRFRIANHIHNVMVKEARRRLSRLYRDSEYKEIISHLKASQGKYRPGDKQKLRDIQRAYGLSEYQFHAYVDKGQSQYSKNIDSHSRQKIATHVWQATASCIFGGGKDIHFHKLVHCHSIEGKSNTSGIRYRNNRLCWNGLYIPVIIKKNDSYICEALGHDICFCRIVRRWHKHQYRYYLQLVMKGISPCRNVPDIHNTSKVGIDIGPSTIACVSEKGVILTELTEDVPAIDRRLRAMQRKLDRQRRMNNPNNYNHDGTIKKDTKTFKKIWKTSRHMSNTADEIRALYKKRAERLKQSHNRLANSILSLGTDIYIEDMDMMALAKRTQKTEVSEQTGKYKKKKRFGKSISNHAPSMLIDTIDRKLAYIERDICKVDTYQVKASQLNHITGEYIKPQLSERWKTIGAYVVQRDLYSAFLLSNMADQATVDIDECFNHYEDFIIMHNNAIEELIERKNTGKRFPSCMGI